MYLHRLELRAIGPYPDRVVIDFAALAASGVFLLEGPTGSGKSTIIDAITFALYGSVARYADNRAVAPVINQTSTRARVRLDFELGEDRYTAVRLVQRTKNGATTKEARLERGDEVLAAAILDRLLHHSHTLLIQGDSYRLKHKRKAGLLPKAK